MLSKEQSIINEYDARMELRNKLEDIIRDCIDNGVHPDVIFGELAVITHKFSGFIGPMIFDEAKKAKEKEEGSHEH